MDTRKYFTWFLNAGTIFVIFSLFFWAFTGMTLWAPLHETGVNQPPDPRAFVLFIIHVGFPIARFFWFIGEL